MKLYRRYLSILLKCQMQYKASFFMTCAGSFLVSFTAFLGLYFMFSRFYTVEGFTMSEVLLCYSVMLMAFTLTECFARGFDVFPQLIKSGDLDRILLRPKSGIFQVLTSHVEFTRVGRLLQAVLMLVYAIPTSGVHWTPARILALIFMHIGGVAVFTSLLMLYAGISFFTIEGLEFMNIFTHGGLEFGKYPVSIYGERILKFFTCVIPIALFQYYPLLYILGRSEQIGLIFLPLSCFIFLIPCYVFFKFGVKKYKSTGS